jgi:Glycosyl hydrolase family 53
LIESLFSVRAMPPGLYDIRSEVYKPVPLYRQRPENQKRGSRATRRDCHQDRWLPNRTFRLLLDFHYSDDWADPEHERTPKAWSKLSHDNLVSPHEDQGRPRLREGSTAPAWKERKRRYEGLLHYGGLCTLQTPRASALRRAELFGK